MGTEPDGRPAEPLNLFESPLHVTARTLAHERLAVRAHLIEQLHVFAHLYAADPTPTDETQISRTREGSRAARPTMSPGKPLPEAALPSGVSQDMLHNALQTLMRDIRVETVRALELMQLFMLALQRLPVSDAQGSAPVNVKATSEFMQVIQAMPHELDFVERVPALVSRIACRHKLLGVLNVEYTVMGLGRDVQAAALGVPLDRATSNPFMVKQALRDAHSPLIPCPRLLYQLAMMMMEWEMRAELGCARFDRPESWWGETRLPADDALADVGKLYSVEPGGFALDPEDAFTQARLVFADHVIINNPFADGPPQHVPAGQASASGSLEEVTNLLQHSHMAALAWVFRFTAASHVLWNVAVNGGLPIALLPYFDMSVARGDGGRPFWLRPGPAVVAGVPQNGDPAVVETVMIDLLPSVTRWFGVGEHATVTAQPRIILKAARQQFAPLVTRSDPSPQARPSASRASRATPLASSRSAKAQTPARGGSTKPPFSTSPMAARGDRRSMSPTSARGPVPSKDKLRSTGPRVTPSATKPAIALSRTTATTPARAAPSTRASRVSGTTPTSVTRRLAATERAQKLPGFLAPLNRTQAAAPTRAPQPTNTVSANAGVLQARAHEAFFANNPYNSTVRASRGGSRSSSRSGTVRRSSAKPGTRGAARGSTPATPGNSRGASARRLVSPSRASHARGGPARASDFDGTRPSPGSGAGGTVLPALQMQAMQVQRQVAADPFGGPVPTHPSGPLGSPGHAAGRRGSPARSPSRSRSPAAHSSPAHATSARATHESPGHSWNAAQFQPGDRAGGVPGLYASADAGQGATNPFDTFSSWRSISRGSVVPVTPVAWTNPFTSGGGAASQGHLTAQYVNSLRAPQAHEPAQAAAGGAAAGGGWPSSTGAWHSSAKPMYPWAPQSHGTASIAPAGMTGAFSTASTATFAPSLQIPDTAAVPALASPITRSNASLTSLNASMSEFMQRMESLKSTLLSRVGLRPGVAPELTAAPASDSTY